MTQHAPETLHTLTVRELSESLKLRGVEMSYSSLSELLNTDDIAAQLHIEGGGNARRILPDVVDVLAAFLPHYRQAKARLPQAASMLRAFLSQGEVQANSETGALATVRQFSQALTVYDPLRLAREQGRAQGLAMTERVLTARQAADVLQLSVRQLRQTVKPYRRFGRSAAADRWRLSDLLEAA